MTRPAFPFGTLLSTLLLAVSVPSRAQPVFPFAPPASEGPLRVLPDIGPDIGPDDGAADRGRGRLEPDSGGTRRVHPEVLACGGVVEDLSGDRGGEIVIPLEVAPETHRLTVTLSGGRGDADLYLKHGGPPETRDYDFRPFVDGNHEEVRVEEPAPGSWFLMVRGYHAFREVEVSLDCVVRPPERGGVDLQSADDIELALYYELSGIDLTNRTQNVELRHELLNQSGREAFNAGSYDKAMEIWTRWMRQDPGNPRPVSLVGDLYLRANNLEEAIRHYRRSLELQPGQVGLMTRLAQLLDQQAERPGEARDLLNRYSRLFPRSASVSLGQAGWLIRRNRYAEATEIIRTVIGEEPENLDAMTLLHPLLRSQEARYGNMERMLDIGRKPGREPRLGYAIREHDLMIQPESWMLMDFIQRMAGEAPSADQRKLFRQLLPREEITVEDFRIGRMSTNWISSREEEWGGEGNLILSADAGQTEAFLRLVRSDAMHNGFIDVEVDDTRGTFWIYARRGKGNMIRFGFEENGQLYLQVWMNDHLMTNETRVWSRPPGTAILRLEVRADGARGYVNGEGMFGSPVTIPRDMGLGWWGIAPWSPQYGTAKVSVRKISGGPLPVRLGLLPAGGLGREEGLTVNRPDDGAGSETSLIRNLNRHAESFSTLAPEWYSQGPGDIVTREKYSDDLEIRLLARYHRMRFLPMMRLRDYERLSLRVLTEIADRDGVDGFTLVVERMPPPDWFAAAQEALLSTGLTLHFVLPDPATGRASFRELCPVVGVFPGARRQRPLSFSRTGLGNGIEFTEQDPHTILMIDPQS